MENKSQNDFSTMEKMNITQLIILILLSLERILKTILTSKCLKKMSCKFLGIDFIDIDTEQEKNSPSSPKNNRNNPNII